MTVQGKIAIKICGMKYPGNISEVASLNPDYLGFILYKGSKRYIDLNKAESIALGLPYSIKKVAVIVDEPLEYAKKIASGRAFDYIQLHGNESADYCREISKYTDVIKAFRISDRLPENLIDYELFCSMFLFDTAAMAIGGTGLKFDHGILETYTHEKPYLIAGGISPEDSGYLKTLKYRRNAGFDLNSRFEVSPGIKNIELLKHFITNIRKSDDNS